jgi:hypothetical protein
MKSRNIATMIVMFLVLINFASAIDHFYKVELGAYANDTLFFNKISVIPSEGDLQEENIFGFNHVDLINTGGEVIDETFFKIPNVIFYDYFDEEGYAIAGGETTIDVNFTLYVPYDGKVQVLEILDKYDIEMLSIDVSPYAKEIPAEGEIPEELEEGIVPGEVEEKPIGTILFPLIGSVLIVIVFVIVFLRKGKKKRHK